MLFGILLTIQIIVCLALGGLVLIQRSEGGALGVGGSPSGFMSARGAGNLLTRATSILGFLFFACAIAMTIVGNLDSQAQRRSALENVDVSKLPATAPVTQPQQAPPPAAAPASSAPSLADLPLGTAAPAPASSVSSSAVSSKAPTVQPAASTSSSSRPAAVPAAPSASAPATSSTTSPAQ
ncbi:preprotein translocase subunit SecG [Asticcacaulis sp. AC402]|uniref:preprotein translocase subunit SecG n=1 Tax=Asticcacaulis sp. AC402 TaxID=1282361 RepID=UPI0003C4117F|nr:preprotein translocase subunit SecG [Asticcacaulis sp. AC402]ESQ75424.1 hypothetical protein ABAC402_10010 [Asticcacaulis sp. AC402]